MATSSVSCQAHDGPHVAIFPLMAKGHTMPLVDLACLLRVRGLAAVTFITTPGNAAFVRAALRRGGAGDDDAAAVLELAYPAGRAPAGGEAAEGVVSASSFAAFAEATSALRPRFEAALGALRPPASLLVADGFLYWAHASAAALGVPSVSFLGTSAFAHVVREACVRDMPGAAAASVVSLSLQQGQGGAVAGVDEASSTSAATYYTAPEFPHLQFSLGADLVPPPLPLIDLDAKMAAAVAASRGLIINTFHDLEGRYIEHWNQHIGPKAWAIGPLWLARQSSSSSSFSGTGSELRAKPSWMQWLDDMAAAGKPVLYVSLGTLAAISEAQLKEVADGLDQAGVNFLWALRPDNDDLGTGYEYEERVAGRGNKVVSEWVDQRQILRHPCVRGFLSHCGWNSVLESVAAGVPLVAWPREFEQPVNAKFVVDELRIGVRVRATGDGADGGLVTSEEITRAVKKLMFGEAAMAMALRAKEIAAQAQLAVSDGGSSWKEVEEMIRVGSGRCVFDING